MPDQNELDHENGMNLKKRVLFVNCRWIETNRSRNLADLVHHCRAEVELKQLHLQEAEQLAQELGEDFQLSKERGYEWVDLWETVGTTHARWISGNPNATVHELMTYLEAAMDQCSDLAGVPLAEALDEMGDELSCWLGVPDDADHSDETVDDYECSISEDFDDVYCLAMIVSRDFKVSDRPKPRWMLKKIWEKAKAARKNQPDQNLVA